jgi:hypothetical protein
MIDVRNWQVGGYPFEDCKYRAVFDAIVVGSLVALHEAAVTDDIGGEDRSEATLVAFFCHLELPLPEGAVQQIVCRSP